MDKHDWFETNDLCKKCSFLTGAFAAKKELEVEGADLHDLSIEIDFLSHAIDDFDINKVVKYDEYVEEIKRLESKLENSDIVLQNIKLQGELEKNKLSSYEEERETNKNNEDSIQHNDKVNIAIGEIDSNVALLEMDLQKNVNETTKYTTLVGQITQKIKYLVGSKKISNRVY